MGRNFLLHLKSGNKIFTEKEIIENALQQEANGVQPHYSFYDYKAKEKITPAGWLVWSTMNGCGVVYRRHDEKMIIITGVQGDFVYC